MVNVISMSAFLTDEQIKKVVKIYKKEPDGRKAQAICDEVIAPNIEAINNKLGQKNDPKYLAYACEHVISMGARK